MPLNSGNRCVSVKMGHDVATLDIMRTTFSVARKKTSRMRFATMQATRLTVMRGRDLHNRTALFFWVGTRQVVKAERDYLAHWAQNFTT